MCLSGVDSEKYGWSATVWYSISKILRKYTKACKPVPNLLFLDEARDPKDKQLNVSWVVQAYQLLILCF